MNKWTVLILAAMAAAACVPAEAGLKIYVNIGNGLWADYPDSKITIHPSDVIQVGIIDTDGTGGTGDLALGIAVGAASGSLDIIQAVLSEGVSAVLTTSGAEQWGMQSPFVSLTNTTPQGAGGWLIQKMLFHCDGPGDVTIALVDNNGNIVDAQVIHQTPEPATLVLLGLGGLVLRKVRA